MRKMKTQDRVRDTKAQGESFTPFRWPAECPRETYMRERWRQDENGKGKELRMLRDPHTVPVVGIRTDVRPIGENGGGR